MTDPLAPHAAPDHHDHTAVEPLTGLELQAERRIPRRLPLELDDPATLAELLDERDGTDSFPDAEPARRPRERLPAPVAEILDEEYLDRRAGFPAQVQPSGNDARVVHDRQPVADEVGELRERAVLDVTRVAAVHEES